MACVDEKLDKLEMGLDEYKAIILFAFIDMPYDAPRSLDDIAEKASEFCDKIWFDRHLVLREKVARGKEKKTQRYGKVLLNLQKKQSRSMEKKISALIVGLTGEC